ncbi:TetR/AcrR family transcriptional regulator [Actinomadura madurae]|uniref:TetR/AcrR family transcriptional regulator n=1 Tax=Actinomadura madurae TaxID=1993 RepID=UPI0020D2309D|nr:TetR/AcrR family transcriptional regulator [Actinomadura madurae]MCP9968367.1 TetR/AcrR family transcriptional regulator [Actinomadura madurae]MCQ0017025.1 TetR/AcrR family transcriptional regulator [Actinomadura madurae]
MLDAARALATEHGGYDAVTVRAVASRVGYAAPVVYQYFSNKHDLLVAVVDTGFAELAERLGRAQCRNKTDMLLATAEEYWAFAMAEPYLYRLMHGLGGVPFGEPNTPKSALDCFHLLAAAAAPRTGQGSGHGHRPVLGPTPRPGHPHTRRSNQRGSHPRPAATPRSCRRLHLTPDSGRVINMADRHPHIRPGRAKCRGPLLRRRGRRPTHAGRRRASRVGRPADRRESRTEHAG